ACRSSGRHCRPAAAREPAAARGPATMSEAAPLEVRGLTRRFGRFTAVESLSLGVRGGEIVGFLGPNGAGKTTTLRCCSGLLSPDAGEIVVAGASMRESPL